MWLTWTSKKLSFIPHSSKWGLSLSLLQGSWFWIYYKRLFISFPKDLHIFTKYHLASCHVFCPECQRPGQLRARTGRLLSVWTPPASHQDTWFLGNFFWWILVRTKEFWQTRKILFLKLLKVEFHVWPSLTFYAGNGGTGCRWIACGGAKHSAAQKGSSPLPLGAHNMMSVCTKGCV